jgi:protein arginine N-methyltransferase 6
MFGGGADGNGHLPRPRRPRRGAVGSGGGGMGPLQGQLSSGVQPHPAAPPCTDYDVAYFKAYSHIGVHEEMLKVLHHTLYPRFQLRPGGQLGGCVA